MDPQFWQERWQRAETGFHQPSANDRLLKYWPALNIERGGQVFVPLCGKSLDMAWLADEGYKWLELNSKHLN